MLPSFRCSIKRARILSVRLPCRPRARVASFTSAARKTGERTALEAEGATTPKEQRGGSSDNGKSRTSAARVPAFALFAVGLPVGWYLSDGGQKSGPQFSLDSSRFVQYAITGKEDVSSTMAVFTLTPTARATIATAVPNAEWAITSVEIKQPQLQIARSYTCLPPLTNQDSDELRLLIRREPFGEVSGFLHRLPIGAQVEVRGLRVEYAIPDDVKSAIFLAGGTGIAPALQVADVLDGEADLHICWANRRREDCVGGLSDTTQQPSLWHWRLWTQSISGGDIAATRRSSRQETGKIVAQLEDLKTSFAASPNHQPWLTVDYFVDEEMMFLDAAKIRAAIKGQACAQNSENRHRRLIFVSGPTGFISHWAGPKHWANGREVQGPLGGVLSTMNLDDWEIVKL